MSLSYEKIKKKHGDDSFWTSYSDLATVLSILFLTLYVIATMRASTVAIMERGNLNDAKQEIASLKEQLQTYEVLKEDYLKGTHQAEQKMYGELLEQMELIEGDTRVEKERLELQAKEAAQKEESLNRYQKMIKNIIQANMIVQKELKTRDQIIREKTQDISQLKVAIEDREKKIAENRQKITEIQTNLKDSVARLKQLKTASAKAKREAKQRLAQLEAESAQQVEALRRENLSAETELKKTKAVVAVKSRELATTQTQLEGLEKEKSKVQAELEKERKAFQSSIDRLSGEHSARLSEEKARYEASLTREKLTAQEQLAREKAYQAKIEAEKGRYAQELKQLESNLEDAQDAAKKKEAELADTREEAQEIRSELQAQKTRFEKGMSALRAEYEANLKAEREAFEAGLAKERLSGAEREARQRAYAEKLGREKDEYNSKMKALAGQLAETQDAIAAGNAKYRSLANANAGMARELADQKARFEKGMGDLRAEYEGNLAKERAAFEAGLAKERLSGAEREARQKAYAEKLAREKDEYNSKMQRLAGQLAQTKQAIAEQDSANRRLSSANTGMERELAALREREEQRRTLAKKIEENFKRDGIDAQINAKTGEVTINFGEEYFETGKASMKDGMKKILEKAMPAYAKGILEDRKLAEKVASVEIVGFASPTFKGNYVNPKDLSDNARKAVDYNMDLSYQRAKSIFDYVFDPKKLKYSYQKQLLPLAKVTGQGYLRAEGAKETKQLSGEEYCAKYDCARAQKVVIKFHFKE